MTDKELSAIAIKEVAYADMLAAGATEELAQLAAVKAQAACEAGWDCAVERACKWLDKHLKYGKIRWEVGRFVKKQAFIDNLKKAVE